MHLALIGYGNIAQALTQLMAEPAAPRPERLTVVARVGRASVARMALGEDLPFEVVESVDTLLDDRPDLAIECAGHSAVADSVPPLLRAGVDCVVVSVGALADPGLEAELQDAARAGGARMILPAGAIGGVDVLSALALGEGVSVTYRGIKPPAAWAGSPAEEHVDLNGISNAEVIFRGSAREAARSFPKNANVAATLALAGGGFEETEVTLVADPEAPGNVHAFEVRAPSARVEMRIENLPSVGNAKTSVSTIYSVLREVRNRTGPVVI